ncbi:MAG: hypothetical protein KatS3mg115_2433 [Candidatus Poribacteria bacterium]|nr:MAG: hypothetical protein KatS3mg115_2433 [Candidatus Poribacteria bacterium]
MDPTTGAFSWTPTFEQIGTYSVSFTVTDANGATSDPATIAITVTSGNHPPQITAVLDADPSTPAVQDPFPVATGGTRLIPLSASDAENDPLTFAALSSTTALGATVELINNILVYRAPSLDGDPLGASAVDSVPFTVTDPFNTVQGSVLFEVIPFRSLAVKLSYTNESVRLGVGRDPRLDALVDLPTPPNPGTDFNIRIVETLSGGVSETADHLRNVVQLPTTNTPGSPTVAWTLTVHTGTADPDQLAQNGNDLVWDPVAPLLSDLQAATRRSSLRSPDRSDHR